MIYHEWGFTGSPFQTTSLPSSAIGEKLLVGRAKELATLVRRVSSAPKLATLEGLNGVGKTSIVNVASYQLFDKHLRTRSGPLYIPCRRIFQLNPQQDLPTFIDQVLMEVAQTLIDRAKDVEQYGEKLHTGPVDRWLNSAQLSSFQAGAWNVQGGWQRETNTSSGFERSGFRKAVTSWLDQVFPTADSGGIVCTIDNLELLQSSDLARAQLEQLRDELLTTNGLRWVLCGALGIVHGVVASPRLEGFLHAPIEIGEINESYASEILSSRIEAFGSLADAPYLPLIADDFAELYKIFRGNLRSVLSYAEDFCQHVAEEEHRPDTLQEKQVAFHTWLNKKAQTNYEAVRQELRPRALQVFAVAKSVGGIFSPSDFASFDFNSIAAFRPPIRDLEAVGLVVSTRDDGDKRRKTIQVTAKGWIVDYHQARLSSGLTE